MKSWSVFNQYFAGISFVLVLSFGMAGAGYAKSEIARDDLKLRIDTRRSEISLYYKELLVGRQIGSFEIYRWALNKKKRVPILRGPWNKAKNVRINRNSVHIHEDYSNGIAAFKFDLALMPDNIIQVKLRLRTSDKWPYGVQFNIVKLVPDWIKGAIIRNPLIDSSTKSRRLPLYPGPIKQRFIVNELEDVWLQGSMFDMEVKTLVKNSAVSLADFRSVYWDKFKSFLLYTNKKVLLPRKWYTFDYQIAFHPPSITVKEQFSDIKSSPVTRKLASITDSYLFRPRKEVKTNNEFSLTRDLVVYTSEANLTVDQFREILLMGTEIVPEFRPWIEPSRVNRGIYLKCRIEPESSNGPKRKGGYQLEVTETNVIINGRNKEACLNGLKAIVSSVKQKNSVSMLYGRKTEDYPDINVRGQVIRLSPVWNKNLSLFKRYIAALAQARANTIIIYHPPVHVKALQTSETGTKWWSRSELKQIIIYARSLGLNVIPGMLSKFKPGEFPDLMSHAKGSNIYCIDNPSSYGKLFSLYETLIDIYKPQEMLIGHDEIHKIGVCAKKGATNSELFAKDIKKIHRWLAGKGIRMLMWGDMLLDYAVWHEKVGSANSNNPFYESGDTHHALNMLPKDIVILDWHYQVKPDYPSIKYFVDHGFTVWGVTWFDPVNAINMAKSVKKYNADGMLGSDWGFWDTLSPASTSIYNLAAAWNSNIKITGEGEDAVADFAKKLRQPLSVSQKFRPISILSAANETTWDSDFADGHGFFDLGGGFDLRKMPEGKQNWSGIELEIATSEAGKTNNIVLVGNGDVSTRYIRGEVRIPLKNIVAKSLAFLHTLYVVTPQIRLRKVGKYVIEYEDGDTQRIDLLENSNITDFRSTPGLRTNVWRFTVGIDELVGAFPGWRGETQSNTPVNSQILVWYNPHPEKQITAVRVVANKLNEKSRVGLLAISYQTAKGLLQNVTVNTTAFMN